MQSRQLVLVAAFLIACGNEGAATDSSIEVASTSPATTIALRAGTTNAPTTTTTPPTTTTRAPTTTTTQVVTTTTATTVTTTAPPTTTTTAGPATSVTITATNFAFSPSSVTINIGDTVQWVLGSGSHTTTSGAFPNPDGRWDQTITAPVAVVFTQSGQFNFFCRFHPDMQGTIVVP
ncbi:MAG: cupredoxin domain-containing protein [Acidimicrobiia bacterium]